jgi:hypothetical protein
MNDPLLAVHLRDLAITPLVFPSDNPYFIILSYRKCPCLVHSRLWTYEPAEENKTHVVFAAQLFRQRRRHNLAANRRGRREMKLARLAPGGRDVCKRCEISALIQKYRCPCPAYQDHICIENRQSTSISQHQTHIDSITTSIIHTCSKKW